jgi:hypothetical protein
MKDSSRRRRQQVHLAVLLCGLVLLTAAERRLAELDFDSTGVVRVENNDKPDGNEIINKLIFVDDAKEPIAPTGDVSHAAAIAVDSCARSLCVIRLSESRAPPPVLPSHV